MTAQIEYLHHELDHANQQLDSNFSRLEAAGLGSIQLAKKLAEAQDRNEELENDIRALLQRNKASMMLLSVSKHGKA